MTPRKSVPTGVLTESPLIATTSSSTPTTATSAAACTNRQRVLAAAAAAASRAIAVKSTTSAKTTTRFATRSNNETISTNTSIARSILVSTNGTAVESRENTPFGAALAGKAPRTASDSTTLLVSDELLLLGVLANEFFASQEITNVEAFLSTLYKDITQKLKQFMNRGWSTSYSGKWITNWKHDILQRRKTRQERVVGLHPTFEVFDGELRDFLAAMSITTPQELLEFPILSRAYVQWRYDHDGSIVQHGSTSVNASGWRSSVKRQLADHDETPAARPNTTKKRAAKTVSGAATKRKPKIKAKAKSKVNVKVKHTSKVKRASKGTRGRGRPPRVAREATSQNVSTIAAVQPDTKRKTSKGKAKSKPGCTVQGPGRTTKSTNPYRTTCTVLVQPNAELSQLGPLAGTFLAMKGITNVAVFLETSLSSKLGGKLVRFRTKRYPKEKVWTVSNAVDNIRSWKRDLLQRRATRKENPVGLHLTFEIFDGELRSFLVAMSITTPQELFEFPTLSRAYGEWRHKTLLLALPPNSSAAYASLWKRSVKRQLPDSETGLAPAKTKSKQSAAHPQIQVASPGTVAELERNGRRMSGTVFRKFGKRTLPYRDMEATATPAANGEHTEVVNDISMENTLDVVELVHCNAPDVERLHKRARSD